MSKAKWIDRVSVLVFWVIIFNSFAPSQYAWMSGGQLIGSWFLFAFLVLCYFAVKEAEKVNS